MVAALLCAACARPAVRVPQKTNVAPRTRSLTIDLGDWQAPAELMFPGEGAGPWPTVVLFHGAGPYDMDEAFMTAPGQPILSTNFKLIAERLAASGFASLRFHKRGVRALGDYDQAQVMRSFAVDQLIADADRVIAVARTAPEVDKNRLYLLGWSQGAQVAANAGATKDIAGLILWGPPTRGWPGLVRYQLLDVGVPYLRDKADKNHDGKLDTTESAGVTGGSVGLFLPREGDLNIKLWAADLKVMLETGRPVLAHMGEPPQQVAKVVASVTVPILVLQGEKDGWVPADDARAVARAAGERATLQVYPGLGHALSPTGEPAIDSFGPMSEQSLDDMVEWLRAH